MNITNRQVDVKALVSHIVRGDGADKCRICMGDTTEGQVYLEDTVMVDGEKPVSLAELLEIITGVEVLEEAALPRALCYTCSTLAINALQFKQLCIDSAQHWSRAVHSLLHIDEPTEKDKTFYIFYNGTDEAILHDQQEKVDDPSKALARLFSAVDEPTPKRRSTKNKKWSRCDDCGKTFLTLSHFDDHLKGSASKRVCTECGIVLPREKLANHLLVAHCKKLYSCEHCYRLFESEYYLNQHLRELHNSNAFVCHVCNTGFTNARGLRAHMYAHSLFHCTVCSLSFENRKCYKYHEMKCRINKRDFVQRKPSKMFKTFICDYCGSEYDKKPSLRIHIIQKHLNVLPYVCVTCGKRTSTLSHLRSHEKTHMTTERVVFRCECGAKFRTELGFRLHERIHTGEKPYPCDECGDCFLSASRRLDHIKRRHRSTKEMPHACQICSAGFVRPFELKKHYTSVHFTTINVQPLKKQIKREL